MEAKNSKKSRKKCEKTDKNRTFLKNQEKLSLEQVERLEDLQCQGLKIIQNENLYCFTSDSVILANFVQTKGGFAVEIGAGSGVISILVQAKNDVGKILAFEIQPEMANLANKNILLNNLSQKIELVCDDAKNFQKYFAKESVDVLFSNPPYFKPTNFVQTQCLRIAKEEVCLTLKELCELAGKMLKHGGRFFLCLPAQRIAEAVVELEKNNLSVKELFFTENGKGKVRTVFIKAVKGGKFGTKVRPNLVTNAQNGDYLEALQTKNFLK